MTRRGFHPGSLMLLPLAALGGCAPLLTGLGGSEQLACKAPPGVACAAVSAVYAAPAPQAHVPAALPPAANLYALTRPRAGFDTSGERQVLRASPRVLRLWIAPWEDADGDLVEETRVHVLVDQGRWLVDAARAIAPAIEAGVKPPAGETPTAGGTQSSGGIAPLTSPDTPFSSVPRQP